MKTNSKYYQYFENKKHTAKELVEFDPEEMLARVIGGQEPPSAEELPD